MFNLKSMATQLNRRRILLGGWAGAVGTLFTLGVSSPARAASRPASHWGTFTKGNPLSYCQHFAKEALQSIGCTIAASDNFLIIGTSGDVSASVTLVPLSTYKTYIIVIANSSDYEVAAKARSDIRSYIQKQQVIDYGTRLNPVKERV
ncbi:MAG: hypothetical protein JO202_10020 [Ktedonobacteraceae bacterium]|nr:hypothetical protein [Ktedonobacteraceae bacterium]